MKQSSLLTGYNLSGNGVLVRENSPTAIHLNSVPNFLPFVGVGTSADLFRTNNDPSPIIEHLCTGLDNGLSLNLSDDELNLWIKVMKVMNKVERFKGNSDLKGLGGNVCEHSLFACLLAYHFFSDMINRNHFSPYEQQKAAELFSDVAKCILVHDDGEWLGEFGTLSQASAGETAKDCEYERNFTEYLFELALLSDDFEGITTHFQERGIAAINEANSLADKSKRDDFLLGKFSELDSELSQLCASLRTEKGQDGLQSYTKARLVDFDRAENYADFAGTFARISEKLEGSLHLLVLINKGHNIKVIGGNHADLYLPGTASYNESALHKLFSYANEKCLPNSAGEIEIPRQIGFGLADSIRREIYNFMAGYSLATINAEEKSLRKPLHYPTIMAMAYLSAAQNGYEPSEDFPVIAKMADLGALKPNALTARNFGEGAKALGIDMGSFLAKN